MAVEEHNARIISEPEGCVASCDCGWLRDRYFDDEAEAVEDWEMHCDDVFYKATASVEPGEQPPSVSQGAER